MFLTALLISVKANCFGCEIKRLACQSIGKKVRAFILKNAVSEVFMVFLFI